MRTRRRAAACVDRDPQTAPHDGDDSMSSVRRCARLCSRLTVLLSVAACASSDRPTGPQSRPEFNISDAVHEGGTPGFYFLPPMVARPTFSGTFDSGISTLNPQIALCDVTNGTDTNCGRADGTPAVIVFTTTSAPRITLDSATTQYHVNWVTKGPAFLAGHTYRVHVTAGASRARRELGFADVLLTSTPGQARNVASLRGDVQGGRRGGSGTVGRGARRPLGMYGGAHFHGETWGEGAKGPDRPSGPGGGGGRCAGCRDRPRRRG